MFDLLSGGRLELGIGRGAYQWEFDRLAGGIPQQRGVAYMKELLPALKGLWQGDYEHKGEYWSFPTATSVPKPLQKPHPRIWIAARDPGTYDWAVANGCSIHSWPITRPFAELETYLGRFEDALGKSPGTKRPDFMTMRHTAIYDRPDGWEIRTQDGDRAQRRIRIPVPESRRRTEWFSRARGYCLAWPSRGIHDGKPPARI